MTEQTNERTVIAAAAVNFTIVQYADGTTRLESGVQTTDLKSVDDMVSKASIATLLACAAHADFVNGVLIEKVKDIYGVDISGVQPVQPGV